MEPSHQSISDMNVKGGLMRARLLYITINHGLELWARVLNHLSDEERAMLGDLTVDEWYPVLVLDHLDRAIAVELGITDEEAFQQLGEFSATTSLTGPYSSLLSEDVHSFLSQSAFIHRSYQNFGQAQYQRLGETSGILVIRYDSAPPAGFCASGVAYFRRSIELCGMRSARVTHTRCRSRGDPLCEFYMNWQP